MFINRPTTLSPTHAWSSWGAGSAAPAFCKSTKKGRLCTSSTIANRICTTTHSHASRPWLIMEEILARFDHHIHTLKHSPDSQIDPIQLVKRAREVGLDGVVITEHDYQWESEELAELAARAAPLLVFSGAEISAREGHFLVYGLPTLKRVPAGITLAELLETVRHHQAAIVAAHPFRWDQPFEAIVAEH